MAETSVLASLGINPMVLIGQVINFGILIFILQKFIYKPILNKLNQRQKLIEKGIESAEKNIEEREKIKDEQKKILSQTQKEAEKVILKAKDDASKMKGEIIAEAKKEAEKIMQKKQNEIEEEFAKQKKLLKNETIDLASQIARKVMEDYLDPKTKQAIIESQLKKLAKTHLN